ncbi:MAG: hypothetical protein QM779_02665 [Propionicimonas sp.]|uniref:hypothetical protein n=1 Tax=Propionicimonas sp. TaxID=1955623 RepID=UPI003D0E587E
MLRIDTWEPGAPHATVGVATRPGHYFRHAGQSPASLSRLVRDHSTDFRCVDRVTAWADESRGDGSREADYSVLGWTSAAVLRTSLSRRLDALNPVAAFRLLDQPEIEQLDRSRNDYVVLRSRRGYGNEWQPELSGAVSALDLDLWIGAGPGELDGAVALDVETYLRRFAATEFSD